MIRAGRMGSFEMSPRGGGGIPTKKEEQGEEKEWEMRPGGMLVQKRSPDSESAAAAAGGPPVPTIRVKVKYESAYYEIYLGAQSTFGELKKMLAERTGLHHQDQKILYKDKERDSSAFLDVCGVKDKSKLVMAMDPTAHAKRVLEMHRAAKLEKAAKSVKGIATEVDNLALQVSNTEATIYEGKKVADKDISNLIEHLMAQLVKLDGIVADGELKLQKGMQVRRVQKYVETLDVLKVKNSKMVAPMPSQKHHHQQHQQRRQQQQHPPSVVVTTEWEMFDSLIATPSTSTSTSTTTSNSTASSAIAPRSNWELF